MAGHGAPTSAKAVSLRRNGAGVPVDCSAEVEWACDGRATGPTPTLSFHCSFLHALRQTAEVCGAGRTLRCDDFVVRWDTLRVTRQGAFA